MPNISTGFTPFRIMYGVQEQYYSILDWVMEVVQLEGMVNDGVEQNLTQSRSKMKNVSIEVKKNLA